MSQIVHQIAAEMSPLVLAAEEANEASIVAICNLMAGAVSRRREIGVLPGQAQPEVLRLKRALDQAIEMQSNVIRFHGRLADRYQTIAGDDIHPFTEEGVQRSAEIATRDRFAPRVIPLRA